MKLKIRMCLSSAAVVGTLLFASFAGAQQKQASVPQAYVPYDASRETVVQGTVTSYTAASETAPVGPHATIQTASGIVDVHLGNANVMKQGDVFLVPGDSVKVVGVSQGVGTKAVFLVRVLQKGQQTITLRNINGIPLTAFTKTPKSRSIFGGAQ